MEFCPWPPAAAARAGPSTAGCRAQRCQPPLADGERWAGVHPEAFWRGRGAPDSSRGLETPRRALTPAPPSSWRGHTGTQATQQKRSTARERRLMTAGSLRLLRGSDARLRAPTYENATPAQARAIAPPPTCLRLPEHRKKRYQEKERRTRRSTCSSSDSLTRGYYRLPSFDPRLLLQSTAPVHHSREPAAMLVCQPVLWRRLLRH